MRTQDRNPAYARFKHVLPKTGRYLAKDATAYWNGDDERKVKDVEVIFWPKYLVPKPVDDQEFIATSLAYANQWESNLDLDERSPENVFGWLVIDGFVDNFELKRALEEFAHIEECEWARAIVEGFRYE